MREELRDELNELLRDGQAWIATISISLPSIIGFLLLVQGNPNVFLVGLWVFILLSVISISIYILFAKKKEQGIYIPLPNGGQIERSVTKYRLLQPYARGSIASSIVVAVILMGVPPLNRPFREVIVGTLTLTLTQTPTQTQTLTLIPSSTVTLSPTSTITLSPTYPPAMSEFLYYMIVLDSSVNMSESFDNRSKWDAALESLNIILDGLNENASYGLVVVGGSGSRSALNPCREPSRLQMSFASREGVRDQINELQPGGGGSFYNGFTLAKNHLENLAIDKIRTLIYITDSNDTCEERDEWGDLERIIPFIDGINVHGEIIWVCFK